MSIERIPVGCDDDHEFESRLALAKILMLSMWREVIKNREVDDVYSLIINTAREIAHEIGLERAPQSIPFEVLAMSIDELELSLRARNVLKKLPALTVGELIKLYEYQLRREPNCGAITINEIKSVLEKLGVSLREDRR